MSEGVVQSVLRCGQCNKPFDKQSTLKRHGYYCRSRRSAGTTRLRSCISCVTGKARCDNQQPGCSRCITKGIECRYAANTPRSPRPRIQHNDNTLTERRGMAPVLVADSPGIENRQAASSDGDTIVDGALVISDPEFTNPRGGYLDWNNPYINFDDFLNPQTNLETVQYWSSGPSSLAHYSTPSTSSTPRIPRAISPTNVRSLIHRPEMGTGTRSIANLIFNTLKSYPLMMQLHDTLPPFIHPSLVYSDAENNDMEPLTNCISLVHMISSGVQQSRKLFWKNVRQECERLREEHSKLNTWELLAGLQALAIYIIIRLDEGETVHNNFDFLLVATVIVLSKQLPRADITSKYDLEISWKDWLFEESTHRLCVIFQSLNMLVYFEPAAMCDLHTDLILAPLPAKRQLWEAGDELVWKAETERVPGVRTTFGLATNGGLVKIEKAQFRYSETMPPHESPDSKTTPSRKTANWEEWVSGMDGLGGLVMLAASLIA